ncbi:trafficking protein particle complex subunit 5 [Phtheirospermum japonicum]|uniref:Trafficking protein particle complex subunit 5 n=1 Tax=Phtheirospermum japonicum TaxID=374723 RepID=A0A830B4B6_9LAMI|nr:trafficking protein particle complex subunit 5 [Phtheirospermum japonicum]
MIGVGKMKQYSNVLDRPLGKGKQEVSLSAFAFLFSELVQYNQTQVEQHSRSWKEDYTEYLISFLNVDQIRGCWLCCWSQGSGTSLSQREVLTKVTLHALVPVPRPRSYCNAIQVADSLEKGTEHEDEYMISEKELLVNRFISIPKDMGAFNCGAFVAGIVRGVLDNAGFPAVVTAHFVPVDGQQRPRTTILIKFAEEVLLKYNLNDETFTLEVAKELCLKVPFVANGHVVNVLSFRVGTTARSKYLASYYCIINGNMKPLPVVRHNVEVIAGELCVVAGVFYMD